MELVVDPVMRTTQRYLWADASTLVWDYQYEHHANINDQRCDSSNCNPQPSGMNYSWESSTAYYVRDGAEVSYRKIGVRREYSTLSSPTGVGQPGVTMHTTDEVDSFPTTCVWSFC
jgi:hypothetical protein